jgi:hypothetical protein
MVSSPAALAGAPQGWAAATLRDGEVALLVDGGGLKAINAVAHVLDLASVSIVRSETTDVAQAETVMTFAGSLPLVWVAASFSDPVRVWARERRPMTLLVEAAGALPDSERGRVERFLALLGRQTE